MVEPTSRKTARLDVGIWFNPDTGQIHIAAKDQFISTVSNDPQSRRFHPNLFKKLSNSLRDAGMPYPPEAEGEK